MGKKSLKDFGSDVRFTAKEIRLRGDLENHLFPHTIPIKEKAALGSFAAGSIFQVFRNGRIGYFAEDLNHSRALDLSKSCTRYET
jgi:hypothetical protein